MSEGEAKHPGLLIDFVVVGGGIAGLGCAIALRKIGHNVTVLEKLTTEERYALPVGGIRIPPNGTKILSHWGLEEEIKKVSVTSTHIHVHAYQSGHFFGSHQWDQEMLDEAGGEYLFMPHNDLYRIILDRATELGANIRTGVEVASVNIDDHEDDPQYTAILTTGERISGDVIVGADSRWSRLQRFVEGSDVWDNAPLRCVTYHCLIPTQLLDQDPDLSFLDREGAGVFVWMGDNRTFTCYPAGKDYFALHYSHMPESQPEGFFASKEELLSVLGDADPRIRKIVSFAGPTISRIPAKIVDPLEQWVHPSGRLVLVGEAAHPLPFGALQAGAMALEDAAVLAKLFSHLASADQIAPFLFAFQDLREARCARVATSEAFNLYWMMLPDGAEQRERDARMRGNVAEGRTVIGSIEREGASQWESVKEMFAYDAEDAADDWWVKWGLLREAAKQNALTEDAAASVASLNISVS
ncbi:FAD/NAD(P)-binding domain-containing protein [Coniophora puteana RWD-64-598 SS2]|uniref:FAD/NAD(P)-binding domain-containing protein n=1 Tax=Coniophora puteana (strain RWD-64-598) TaxID=741705 RepID=A0A5M3MXB1_CONPW|nr:FAD/NAD(P)-binding domain-containing protein [Coniophora puteana RWD-64-598 SS2]EIW83799.1 FAD/NAD(P)-binding domain-containing protein [Coniophora puteana RWD-64-598 SS2]